MTERFFGGHHPHFPPAETPVCHLCLRCGEPIAAGDQGWVYDRDTSFWAVHYECRMREIVGSVAHQEGRCSCFGGDGSDDEFETKREAARAAVKLFHEKQDAEAKA